MVQYARAMLKVLTEAVREMRGGVGANNASRARVGDLPSALPLGREDERPLSANVA